MHAQAQATSGCQQHALTNNSYYDKLNTRFAVAKAAGLHWEYEAVAQYLQDEKHAANDQVPDKVADLNDDERDSLMQDAEAMY